MTPMATVERSAGDAPTHEVFNQSPPLEDYNVFEADRSLIEALRREGAGVGRGALPRARRDRAAPPR